MSIFGSMTTAVLGLSAQSKALGHISDNIANASTAGYKRVNTAFETLVLQSNQRLHEPGGVTAAPVFMNNIQGNLTQVQSATNAAIQGQGFFSVSKLSRGLTGPGQSGETVQTQTGTLNADNVYYTRVGDFELDKNRYLVNSAGFALNGWIVDDITGQLKKDLVQPIQVNTTTDKPQPTQSISLSANLPATPKNGVPIPSSSIQIFDTQGNPQTIKFNWRQESDNNWRLAIDAPNSTALPLVGGFKNSTAAYTLKDPVAGQTPVAQVDSALIAGASNRPQTTLTLGGPKTFYPDNTSQDNIRIGDTYTITANGTSVATLSITAANIASFPNWSSIATNLVGQIAPPYTASIDPSNPLKISVMSNDGYPVDLRGTFTNLTSPQTSAVNGPVVNPNGGGAGLQTSQFTFSTTAIDAGDEFRVTVAGKEFKTRVTPSNLTTLNNINGVVADLVTQINAQSATLGMTAAAGAAPNQNQLILTSTVANATVATSAAVTNAVAGSNALNASSHTTYSNLNPVTTAGTLVTPETSVITFPSTALKVPDVYVVNVYGTEFKVEVNANNINTLKDTKGVIQDLVDQISANTSLGVTPTITATGDLLLTSTVGAPTMGVSAYELDINSFDNVRIGDSYTVRIDNVPYTVQVTKDNIDDLGSYGGVANALAEKIANARPAAAVKAEVVNSELKLTAINPGTPFTSSSEFNPGSVTNNTVTTGSPMNPTDARGQRQEFTFPQTDIDIGDRFSVTIDGKRFSVDVGKSNFTDLKDIDGVLGNLASAINGNSSLNVTATVSSGRLTITHNTPLTGHFAAEATVENAKGSVPAISSKTVTTNTVPKYQHQDVTLDGSPGDKGARYSITIGSRKVTYETTGDEDSMEEISTKLADLINKDTSLPVTATVNKNTITVTAKKASGDVADQFTLSPEVINGETPAHIKLAFGTNSDNVGTITKISTAMAGNGATASTSVNQETGSDATVTFTVNYGFGDQQITLNLGKFGKSGGVTQFAGQEINVTQLVQDGASRGQFKEVVYGDNGDVIVNYDNGRSRTIGRIPVVTFNNPNSLQREAGGVYIETEEGGRPNFNDPDTNGAGAVVANSIESSNVDIADEFTKLIVTQRTYSANTKIVTTSDEMLQEVLGLKR